jgi:hypothetical protein
MTYRWVQISGLVMLFMVMGACKSTKNATNASAKEKSARVVLNNFEDNRPKFKTVNGRIKAGYTSVDDSQSINITYRIEKDKAIWMSAKLMGLLTVAKVYITPDRFQYYEKINRTYFDGNFAMAKAFLGVEVNFQNLQNLLIGQPMFELKRKQMIFDDDAYVFLQNINNVLAYSAMINNKDFILSAQSLRSQNNESLEVDYQKFQTINRKRFPSRIQMLAKKDEDRIVIDLEYRSMTFDEELSFPFSIPNNYERIKL